MSHACGARPTQTAILYPGAGSTHGVVHPGLLAEWVRLAPPAGRSCTAAGRVRRCRDRPGMSHACGARPTRTAILSSGPGSIYEVVHPALLAERLRLAPPAGRSCTAAGRVRRCRDRSGMSHACGARPTELPSSTLEQDQHTGLFTRASWRRGSDWHLQQVGRARPQAVCDAAGTGPECGTPAAHDLPELLTFKKVKSCFGVLTFGLLEE